MKLNGDVIIIEDDADDRWVLKSIFEELGYPNPVIFFDNTGDALEYVRKPGSDPFIIISDINMSKPDGFELRNTIFNDPETANVCVPYIFLTTSNDADMIADAFGTSIQGYFVKKSDFNEQKEVIRKIIDYWKESMVP